VQYHNLDPAGDEDPAGFFPFKDVIPCYYPTRFVYTRAKLRGTQIPADPFRTDLCIYPETPYLCDRKAEHRLTNDDVICMLWSVPNGKLLLLCHLLRFFCSPHSLCGRVFLASRSGHHSHSRCSCKLRYNSEDIAHGRGEVNREDVEGMFTCICARLNIQWGRYVPILEIGNPRSGLLVYFQTVSRYENPHSSVCLSV